MNLLKKPHILFLFLLWSPYIVKGNPLFRDLRVDHLFLFFVGVYFVASGKVFRLGQLFPLFMLFLIVGVSTYINCYLGKYEFSLQLLIRAGEWYLRGFFIFMFVRDSLKNKPIDFIALFRILIFSSVLVNIIGVLQLTDPFASTLNPLLETYYSGTQVKGGKALSYIEMTASSGRAVSILIQTGTAGLFALLVFSALLYLKPHTLKIKKPVYWALMAQSLLGGFLPLSKGFFLGAPAILMIFTLWGASLRKIFSLATTFSIFALIVLFAFDYLSLDEQSFYAGLQVKSFTSWDEMYDRYFAPRFSEKTGTLYDTVEVIKTSPLIGLGIVSGIRLADSFWVPLFVFGGILGGACYLWFLISVCKPIFTKQRRIFMNLEGGREIFRFYVAIFLVFFTFGLGTPTFSQDRIGDFFWILTAMLYCHVHKKHTQKAS